MQEGLLQFLQGGELAFVEASEVLGFNAQVVGGLLAVFNAGIAQQDGKSEGQQKLRSMLGPTDAASGSSNLLFRASNITVPKIFIIQRNVFIKNIKLTIIK